MSETVIVTTLEQLTQILTEIFGKQSPNQMPAEVVALEMLKRKNLLTEAEVELLYGIPQETLRTWRCRGKGPEFSKIEGKIGYVPKLLDRYISERNQKHC